MKHCILTVDLGFGDAGKGSVVDALTREHGAHTVVRYSGGAQAAHRVVEPGAGGREHVFSQFGSGTLAGAATYLSRYMLLDPLAMLSEERHLRELGVADAFAHTTIDQGALVITPFARAINRLRELARGDQRHGSCGMGIGETVADQLEYGERVLRAGDLADPDVLVHKLAFMRSVALAKLDLLRPDLPASEAVELELEPLLDPGWLDWLLEQYAGFMRRAQIVPSQYLHELLDRQGTVIFEAAQGVLLDEWYGFHPHTTWSTTTLANAEQLLAEANYTGTVQRLGITRAYTTRHGAGPMPSENSVLCQNLPDARNLTHPWQQGFRVGWLDLVLLRYGIEVAGRLDSLALTCMDRLSGLEQLQICAAYEYAGKQITHLAPAQTPSLEYQAGLTAMLEQARPVFSDLPQIEQLPALLTERFGLPVSLLSYGPSAAEKTFLP